MAATRFVADEIADEIATPASRQTRSIPVAASHVARWLSWAELAVLMPSRLVAAVGWFAIPLLVLAIVPIALLGLLMLVQAPIFFVMWKLFGGVASDGGLSGEASGEARGG
ncbi:MAG: hypothetical protein WD875_09410 [Pirellulales bacterium]